MKNEMLEEIIIIPEKVQASLEGSIITVKGPKGELSKNFRSPKIKFSIENDKLKLYSEKPSKREKTLMLTFKAHINNMIKGTQNLMKYELKICSGHFPMSVAIKGNKFEIKNFLGEKVPRVMKLKEGAKVVLNGEIISIESVDIEIAGTIASDIEQLTRITNKDSRIFQDGIYITKKPKQFD